MNIGYSLGGHQRQHFHANLFKKEYDSIMLKHMPAELERMAVIGMDH